MVGGGGGGVGCGGGVWCGCGSGGELEGGPLPSSLGGGSVSGGGVDSTFTEVVGEGGQVKRRALGVRIGRGDGGGGGGGGGALGVGETGRAVNGIGFLQDGLLLVG